ncbi:MAG: zinc ribbon domain-containing protein [Desulfobacterales bacterium]|jgi:putative FmdB family regulatory protein
MKALTASGRLSTVLQGLLCPFQLDFSQIMANIELLKSILFISFSPMVDEVMSMPVYEFECSCGAVTEELTKMDTRSIACPKCGNKAKKIISACSFELKGGGWYADGYASKKSGSTSESTK